MIGPHHRHLTSDWLTAAGAEPDADRVHEGEADPAAAARPPGAGGGRGHPRGRAAPAVPHRRQEVLLLGQGHLHRRPVPLPRTRQRLSGQMLILLKYFLITSNIFQVSSAGEYTCKCRHNTCGELCDSCCPMYNQRRWTTGKFISGNECERCQCYGEYCIFYVLSIFFTPPNIFQATLTSATSTRRWSPSGGVRTRRASCPAAACVSSDYLLIYLSRYLYLLFILSTHVQLSIFLYQLPRQHGRC